MNGRTWAHRATHPLVRRLAATRVAPNHLTALRLFTGLVAAGCFATGRNGAAGLWFLASAFLDRADGELARLTGRTSPAGHRFDLASDLLVTSLAFVAIGVALRDRPDLGFPPLGLGLIAGVSIAAIFARVAVIEASAGTAPTDSRGGFDADDALFLIAPVAWLGWLPQLLLAAAIGAPLFFLLLWIRPHGAGPAP
jgi:phosphatidylglycerophosphate synthase